MKNILFSSRMKDEEDKAFVKMEKEHSKLAVLPEAKLFALLETRRQGLSEEEVCKSREKFGENHITYGKKKPLLKRIVKAFINPFTLILIFLALISAITDIIIPLYQAEGGEYKTVIIIVAMVSVSGLLRFVQESRSDNAASKLLEMITTKVLVNRRKQENMEIPLRDLVVGDIVRLSAGSMVPADMRIIQSKDLFVAQSVLTGESEPVEKHADLPTESLSTLTEYRNLVFMGNTVVSGSALGVVLATGNQTMLGQMTKSVAQAEPVTSFEKGVNSVSWVLIRFMLIMVPVVLFINGFTKGDWLEAFFFAVSVAVGLTPEMLPMIVTTSLARGSVNMSKKKTIVKNLNSIQNLGAIDILCTDKTDTLTPDDVILEYHRNIDGVEDDRVLKYAYLNSYYQTGLVNLMDRAIIDFTKRAKEEHDLLRKLQDNHVKIDEVPFDFQRRRMSVVVQDTDRHVVEMITKGALEEIVSICENVEYEGKIVPLTNSIEEQLKQEINDLNMDGMRVIAIAYKVFDESRKDYTIQDESKMTLLGYLTFLDPPKESAHEAIHTLDEYGVKTKILTGDNDRVTRSIAKMVGMERQRVVLGSEIDTIKDEELSSLVETVDIFAKLTPMQKARIVRVLRENGHVVGFMGDGINDAIAMKNADVSISVDSAVDIAKESADIILLKKDLMVLRDGIIEGRKTYANMIKYIKMTASSNFGNMFSVLVASALLPFLPMLSIHLLLLNLIYDFSCTAIPWDNVDDEFLVAPRKWDASALGNFMIWFGPTSSIFDWISYWILYFWLAPQFVSGGLLYHQIEAGTVISEGPLKGMDMQIAYMGIFQAGWFIESMWTQSLVVHMIRTAKIPFIQSRASWPLTLLTFLGIAIITIIPFTTLGSALGFVALPMVYFAILFAIILGYMSLVTLVKYFYIRRYGSLL